MNLHSLLAARESDRRPVRAVLVGAGKFGSLYLAPARRTPGLRILAVADLSPERARTALERAGWPRPSYPAASLAAAARDQATFVTDDAGPPPAHPPAEVVI